MLLLHGEALLFERLLKPLGVILLPAVGLYIVWSAVGRGKRN
jgi:hypothetical protein